MNDVTVLTRTIEQQSQFVSDLITAMGTVIVGQERLLERLLIGILANGHVLLEGVPGLAKTRAVITLAQGIEASYQRIQFTPDLLPADLTGTLILQPQSGEFQVRKGPIFANILLADEINRAPAKVQSALLEAMQEGAVTIGEETFPLPEPFLVLATQNPIEHEGTYPLPEAQMDRFMFKISIDYPDRDSELRILDMMATTARQDAIDPVIDTDMILESRRLVDTVFVDDKVKGYIVDVVLATRTPGTHGLDIGKYIEIGASPRASIYIALAAKAHAFVQGRGFVTPHDVKAIGPDVLRHRVLTTYEADADSITTDDLVDQIFDAVPVP